MRSVRHQERSRRQILQELRSTAGECVMTLRVNPQPPASNSQRRASNHSGVGSWQLGVVLVVLVVSSAFAQDMPDPSLIHGRAIPAPEIPNGTVTVRVVREAIG